MGDKQRVNPFAIGGAFVQYCIDHHILEVEILEMTLNIISLKRVNKH